VNRQQTADSRQQAAGSRQQTADSRQQTADSRQQTDLDDGVLEFAPCLAVLAAAVQEVLCEARLVQHGLDTLEILGRV
jgi:hypothetical protein